MKKRVLYHGYGRLNENVHGVKTYVKNLAINIGDGFEIHVLAELKNNNLKTLTEEGVFIHNFPLTFSYHNVFSRMKKLRKLVFENNFDIIHAHTLRYGLLTALSLKTFPIKKIYTGHGLRYTQKKTKVEKCIFQRLEKYVCQSVDSVIFIRNHDQKVALDDGLVKNKNHHVIPTCISGTRFLSEDRQAINELKQKLNIPKNAIVIGNVGSLIPIKDPILFIGIAKIIVKSFQNVYFIWLGDGYLYDGLLYNICQSNLEDNLLFAGSVKSSKIQNYYKLFDVFLSTSKTEVFPISVIEAKLSRVPVVFPQFGGYEDVIIEGKTGLSYKVGDDKGAAEQIIKLISQPGLRKKITEAAFLEAYENYANIDSFVNKHKNIYLS